MNEESRETDQRFLQDKIVEEERRCFSYLQLLARLSPDGLKVHGYSNFEEAARGNLAAVQTRIEQLVIAFEKKYPS